MKGKISNTKNHFSAKRSWMKGFGGELARGKRKVARPLSVKNSLHLVLRAETKICSLRETPELRKIIDRKAKKFGVRIYNYAFDHTHIHLLALFKSREQYVAFIRQVSAQIVYIFKIKWLHRPFSRIVTWGRDYQATHLYVLKNNLRYFVPPTSSFRQAMLFVRTYFWVPETN